MRSPFFNSFHSRKSRLNDRGRIPFEQKSGELGHGRDKTVDRHCYTYSISPVCWRVILFLPREEHRHGSPRCMGGRSTGSAADYAVMKAACLHAVGRQEHATVCHVVFFPSFLSHVFYRILASRSSMRPTAVVAVVLRVP